MSKKMPRNLELINGELQAVLNLAKRTTSSPLATC